MSQYHLIRRLGRGTYGDVWLVNDLSQGFQCVMKRVPLDQLSPAQQESARNEACMMASTDHFHVIRYHDSFISNGHLCIVMEHASGGDLKDKLARIRAAGTSFPEPEIWRYLVQTLLGLVHLHDSVKLVHRDIKPDNLFLDAEDNVKIGDLGLGRRLDVNALARTTGIGTPLYFSPELCQERGCDVRTDIWSLGCSIYELAAGQPPFIAETEALLIRKILHQEAPPLSSELFSDDLRSVVAWMLQKDPQHRPFARDLLALGCVDRHRLQLDARILMNQVEVARAETAYIKNQAEREIQRLQRAHQAEVAQLRAALAAAEQQADQAARAQRMRAGVVRTLSFGASPKSAQRATATVRAGAWRRAGLAVSPPDLVAQLAERVAAAAMQDSGTSGAAATATDTPGTEHDGRDAAESRVGGGRSFDSDAAGADGVAPSPTLMHCTPPNVSTAAGSLLSPDSETAEMQRGSDDSNVSGGGGGGGGGGSGRAARASPSPKRPGGRRMTLADLGYLHSDGDQVRHRVRVVYQWRRSASRKHRVGVNHTGPVWQQHDGIAVRAGVQRVVLLVQARGPDQRPAVKSICLCDRRRCSEPRQVSVERLSASPDDAFVVPWYWTQISVPAAGCEAMISFAAVNVVERVLLLQSDAHLLRSLSQLPSDAVQTAQRASTPSAGSIRVPIGVVAAQHTDLASMLPVCVLSSPVRPAV